jgi:HD-GYP domain-containing protein (c-di-GMP phosphodiesterase class II)
LAHLKAYFDKTTSEGEGKLEEVAYTAQEVIQSLGALLGFTPEVQEIAKQGIKATLAVVGTNPKLQDFLKRLGTDQTHYITSHSMALARVACSISASMDWPSGSTFLKLTFASFFHDITLTNQALCKIRTNEELLATGNQFTVEECDEFRNHPNAAADLIRSYPEVPADVDVIIRQHHELPDGSGFPRKIGGPALAPLSCVFIFSHGLVRAFYEPNPQESVTQFLNDFRERYNNSTFRKIYAALDKNREAFAAAGIPI